MPLDKDRKKAIDGLLKQYKKDHDMPDDIPIGFLSDSETIGVIEHLSTGNLGFDILSNGGLIKGKVNIIWGGENTGKSTLMLDTIANLHKTDPNFIAAICDNEKVFDRDYALSKGIDPERLIIGAGFKSAENAYDFCNKMAQSGLVDMLVVDTIQALASKSEMEDKKGKSRSTEDDSMALIPRLLSQFLRMYTSQAAGNVTLVLLSQVRLDLGGAGTIKTAKKTGGKAIDHYNILNVKLQSVKAHSGSDQKGTKWPWSVATEADAPPKSFTLYMRIDKAKMQGRYDGNVMVMHFHQGEFEEKLNVLAIAKRLGLHDGKTLKYFTSEKTIDGNGELSEISEDLPLKEAEFKAKGFRDMYNRVPEEAIAWLKTQLMEAYNKQISFHKEDIEQDECEITEE